MTEFNQYGFATGKVRLVRKWHAYEGRLCGLFNAQFWTEGENLARCPIAAMNSCQSPIQFDTVQEGWEWFQTQPPKCDNPNCTCGFYGYFNQNWADTYNGDVVGVIEGWGKCAIGSRGAQVEKARIVALASETAYGFPLMAAESNGVVVVRGPSAARVPERYPNIPFYPSVHEMLGDHPVGEVDV